MAIFDLVVISYKMHDNQINNYSNSNYKWKTYSITKNRNEMVGYK